MSLQLSSFLPDKLVDLKTDIVDVSLKVDKVWLGGLSTFTL